MLLWAGESNHFKSNSCTKIVTLDYSDRTRQIHNLKSFKRTSQIRDVGFEMVSTEPIKICSNERSVEFNQKARHHIFKRAYNHSISQQMYNDVIN